MPYIKETFDVTTFPQAKNVVLSDDPNNPKKFDEETDFLVKAIKDFNIVNCESIVLDFGCGMGRVSKKLIDVFNCNVIGTDISPSMLQFANIYVSKPKQFKTAKSYIDKETIDICLSAFVIQHTESPVVEINNIYDVLKPNGYFVLLNEHKRFIPNGVDSQRYVVWNDDGFDVHGYVETRFKKINSVQYMSQPTEIILYQKI